MNTINKRILNLTIAICILCTSAFSTLLFSQVMPRPSGASQSAPARMLFSADREKTHLGGGISISPDVRLLVFVGDDNRLYLRDIDTAEEKVLLEDAGAGLDVFYDPEFSSDGKRILFAASGGTRYYPSNIYSIELDGSGLQRLTQARQLPASDRPLYAEYFSWAKESPDATRVLLQVYDAVAKKDRAAVLDRRSRRIQYPVEGRPIAWSNDNQWIYYAQEGTVRRLNLNTGESQALDNLSGQIVGKAADRETFAIVQEGRSMLATVQDHSITARQWNIPSSVSVSHVRRETGRVETDQLTLTSVAWSRSARLALYYQSETL